MAADGPFVVGDIGGTNARFAVWEDGVLSHVLTRTTAELPRLAAVLDEVRAVAGVEPLAVSLSVAGPVRDGAVSLTNAAWQASESDLALPTRIQNDLAGAALGIELIAAQDAVRIGGDATRSDHFAVLGVGTGLGQALHVKPGLVLGGEGGHVDFAPHNDEQDELLRFLRARYGHVSWERVVSGTAMSDLLAFTSRDTPLTAPARDALHANPAGKVVTTFADSDPACARAMDLFVRCVGAVAGNLALQTLPPGGVWLVGGIPPKTLPFLLGGPFREAFEDKGRMRAVVEPIAAYVVTREDLGLLGAARAAQALVG